MNFLDYFSFALSPESLAYFIFLLLIGVTAVISGILFFHWKKYGMGGRVLSAMEILYLVGVTLFLGIAFLALY